MSKWKQKLQKSLSWLKGKKKKNSWKEEGVKEEGLFLNVRKCKSI